MKWNDAILLSKGKSYRTTCTAWFHFLLKIVKCDLYIYLSKYILCISMSLEKYASGSGMVLEG